MKKDIFKKVVAGAVLTSTLATAGCGKKEETVEIDSFAFQGVTAEFNLNDLFSVDGIKLNLTMSDGTTKTIDVTSSMVKNMPDMTTPGVKNITITYNGVEYTFSITVKTNTEEMLEKIAEFKDKYEKSGKVGNVTTKLSYDLSTNYFGESGSLSGEYDLAYFTESGINSLEDKFISHAYSSLVKTLVDKANSITSNEVTDAVGMKAQINLATAMTEFASRLSNFNYADYVIKDVLFPGETGDAVENISITVYDMFYIESTAGKNAVKSFVNTNIRNLINGVAIDPLVELGVFNTIVQTHSANPQMKILVNSAYQNVIANPSANSISSFISALAGNNLCMFYVCEEDSLQTIETEAAIEFSDNLLNAYANFVKSIEDYFVKLTQEEEINHSEEVAKIKTACDNIVALKVVCENNGWRSMDIYLFEYFQEASTVLSKFDEDILKWLAGTLQEYGIVEMLTYTLFEQELNWPEEVSSTVSGIIYDLLNRNEDYDYATYITNLCNALNEAMDAMGLEAEAHFTEDQINSYIATFEADKTFKVLSAFFDKVMPDEMAQKEYFIAIIDYLENIPVDCFEFATLQDKAKALFDVCIDECNTEIAELEEKIADSKTENATVFNTLANKYALMEAKSNEVDAKHYEICNETDEDALNQLWIEYDELLEQYWQYNDDWNEYLNDNYYIVCELEDNQNLLNNWKETKFQYELFNEFFDSEEEILKNANDAVKFVISKFDARIAEEEEKLENPNPNPNPDGSLTMSELVIENLEELKKQVKILEHLTNSENEFIDNLHAAIGDFVAYAQDEIDRLEEEKEAYEEENPSSGNTLELLDFEHQISTWQNIKETYNLFYQLTDSTKTFEENLKALCASDATHGIYSEALAIVISEIVGINVYGENTEAYEELKGEVAAFLANAGKENFDYKTSLNGILGVINEHCGEETKNGLVATLFAGIVASYPFAPDTDYNEIFSFIELPEAIEEVDYNQFVQKVWDSESYKTSIEGVNIEYIEDENGEIVRQVMSIDLVLDMDALVVGVEGRLRLVCDIDFLEA